jgi:hypothetical protein
MDIMDKNDVRQLKIIARRGAPARTNAGRLKRTEGATRQKAFQIGVSLATRA